jgi:hypothetical protein
MKNGVFLDVTPCGSVKTDVSEEYIASVIRLKNQRARNNCKSKLKPKQLILFILMMETIQSSETPVLTTATRRSFPEDVFLTII